MQLALNLDERITEGVEGSNRIIASKQGEGESGYQSCIFDLRGLGFMKKYNFLKRNLSSMKLTLKNEVKATFYFAEETKVEIPHHFKQIQTQWVKEITLKLTLTNEGLWISKLKTKRAGRSLYDFPLDFVERIALESIEKSETEMQKLAQFWKRKHSQVWHLLDLADVSKCLDKVEYLELEEYFTQEDLEYAEGCFEWEDEVELKVNTKHRIIKLHATTGEDHQYRTWATVFDTRRRLKKYYLWLTPTKALFYKEESY